MDANKDYYSILGVMPSAETDVIKAVYRALAKRYHPDIYDGPKEEAEKLFKELGEAFTVLSDPNLRAAYDRARPRDKSKREASNSRDSGPSVKKNHESNQTGQQSAFAWKDYSIGGIAIVIGLFFAAAIPASRVISQLSGPSGTEIHRGSSVNQSTVKFEKAPIQPQKVIPDRLRRETQDDLSSAASRVPSAPNRMLAVIQTRLNQFGWNAGAADGLLGPQTRSAISRFQSHQGLPINGEPSRELFDILETAVAADERCYLRSDDSVACN